MTAYGFLVWIAIHIASLFFQGTQGEFGIVGSNHFYVSPLEEFTVSGYYKYCLNSTYCPTCIRQVYVNIFNISRCVLGGIDHRKIDCKQHYFSAQFVTPATPAKHYNISISETLLYKCPANPSVPRNALIYGTVTTKGVNTTEAPGCSCDQPLNATLEEVKQLFLNDSQAASKASSSLEVMANITTKTVESSDAGMGQLNIITAVDILERFVRLNEMHNNTVIVSAKDQQNFVNIASSLLSPSNNKNWQENPEMNSSSVKLIKTLDDYGFQVAKELPGSGSHVTSFVYSQNIVMKVDKLSHDSQVKSKGLYFDHGNSSLYLPPEALNSSSIVMAVSFIYRNLDRALNHSVSVTRNPLQSTTKVGTTIVSSSVRPYPSFNLSSPIVLKLHNQKPYYGPHQPTCVFYSPGSAVTQWLPTGCSLVAEASDSNVTTCQCSHLTVFAALVDPYHTPGKNVGEHKRPLEIISLVGCSFSLCGTLLTIIIVSLFWSKLKSPRTVILLNLCVAVATWCILIMLESFVRSSKSGCTVVAVLLHYFLLASFLWMLCQGVLLYSMLVTVVGGGAEDKLKYFFGVGWGVPALVVSTSFWSTGGDGYGSNWTCWLSTNNGLIWAFVGPVLFIITCNTVVLILVLRNLIRCRFVQLKSRIEKIKSSVKATAVMLPLLGLTWIFGILSFNSETLVFKYAFSLFNSLQGMMIFVFHCLLNTQVRDAIRPRRNVKVVISKTNRTEIVHNQIPNLALSHNHLRTAWRCTGGKTLSADSSRRSSQSSRGSDTALELQIYSSGFTPFVHSRENLTRVDR